jgi:hypothetical protein
MNTYNIELQIDEIGELHVTLCLRVAELEHETASPNRVIAEIAERQLRRVLPMRDYFQSIMIDYHQNSAIETV